MGSPWSWVNLKFGNKKGKVPDKGWSFLKVILNRLHCVLMKLISWLGSTHAVSISSCRIGDGILWFLPGLCRNLASRAVTSGCRSWSSVTVQWPGTTTGPPGGASSHTCRPCWEPSSRLGNMSSTAGMYRARGDTLVNYAVRIDK